jgi:hypothetical protein
VTGPRALSQTQPGRAPTRQDQRTHGVTTGQGVAAQGVAAQGEPILGAVRYGIYLAPDPPTCWCVTQLTGQLRAQYGFVSAGAFPPHATLVGSQYLTGRTGAVIEAVGCALAGRRAFTVYNSGIRLMGEGFAYDVHHLADGITPNPELTGLARAIDARLAPLRSPVAHHQPVNYRPGTFRAHLSLASHDLLERPDLREEVKEYLHALPIYPPQSFTGRTVALYATFSDDWSGRWWRTLRFEHLHSWRLPTG